MPPEMINNEPHDYRLDIWGLGILLYVFFFFFHKIFTKLYLTYFYIK